MLTIEDIKKAVVPICERYGVERLSLFGSYARGEADEQSDVDLIHDGGNFRGWEYGGFYGDLQRALGLELDLVDREEAGKRFLSKIAKDEVLLYAR
ncbi:MAG: nucleotidyltransferase domain-containing protein [Selenomonadaceae bacterium]|nr:nucleotidyltransferase domain-containing protein [Selenomonadaceae bacterium]